MLTQCTESIIIAEADDGFKPYKLLPQIQVLISVINCFKNKKTDILIKDYVNDSEKLAVFLDLTKSLFSSDYITHYRTLETDGNFIWSSDLNIYTKDYNFIWPNKIVNQIYSLSEKEKKVKDYDFRLLEAELVVAGYYDGRYEDYVKIIELH